MAYLDGAGTAASPYLIGDFNTLKQLLTTDIAKGYYAAVVNDIDCTGNTISYKFSSIVPNVRIDLRGRKVKGLNIVNTSESYVLLDYVKLLYIENGEIDFYAPHQAIGNRGQLPYFYRCKVNLGYSYSSDTAEFIECMINGGGGSASSGSSGNYKYGAVMTNTINTSTFVDGSPYARGNYPTFNELLWVFDGISLPHPRLRSITDITNRMAVKGVTQVGGVGKSRKVCIYSAANGYRYKEISSNNDGSYLANINDVSEPVLVLHFDSPGLPLQLNKSYVINDVIRPDVLNGYRYICTTAGSSGGVAPSTWPTTGSITIGSAIFTALPIYEPASLLVNPRLVNIVTGEPL